MKILHTSDWHVGKQIRGMSRADEHRSVLAEIATIAEREAVDLVLVAGDLFETAAPTPESERIVYRALLDLAKTGAHLAVISGNHDNARRLEAVAPMLEAIGHVHVLTRAARPDDGGVRRFTVASGEDVTLAMLPFVSKRGIVRAAELWSKAAFELGGVYRDRVARMLELLTREFSADTVNLLMAHTFVHGASQGGGERQAHFIEDYGIDTQMLPSTANYIALGHVHRPQKINAGSPTRYCGSPLQMDFGEKGQRKQVNIVDVAPGTPGKVTEVALTSGVPLVRLQGTVDAVDAAARGIDGPAWIQTMIEEPQRGGLADEVRERLGERVIDVRIVGNEIRKASRRTSTRVGRAPTELFDEYLGERNVEDSRIRDGFAKLLDHELDEAAT